MAEQKKENSSKFISVELAATRLEIRDVNMYKKGAGGVGVCEGNCDSDIDCGIGLMSFQRDRYETLSGYSVATMFFSPVLLRGRELLAVSLYTLSFFGTITFQILFLHTQKLFRIRGAAFAIYPVFECFSSEKKRPCTKHNITRAPRVVSKPPCQCLRPCFFQRNVLRCLHRLVRTNDRSFWYSRCPSVCLFVNVHAHALLKRSVPLFQNTYKI